MSPDAVKDDILARFPDLIVTQSWGETAFFYNPGHHLKRGVYVATIKERDGANDRASNLARESVWRLNLGVPPALFEAEFGARPERPSKGGIIAGNYDFSALDTLMPHPIYAWMGWVAILCPSADTYQALGGHVDAAFEKAKTIARKRLPNITHPSTKETYP